MARLSLYLLDLVKPKEEFPEMRVLKWPHAEVRLIEYKAMGRSIVQNIMR